jgi:hypothetical protein
MAKQDDQYDDELLDEQLDEGAEEQDEDNKETVAAVSGWGISLALHAIILLILATIVIAQQIIDPAPTRMARIDPPPKPPETPREIKTLEKTKPVEIDAEVVTENPVVTQLDVPVTEVAVETLEVTEVNAAKGREEAVSDSERGGAGAFSGLGAGGGGSGMMGNRFGSGKKRALGKFGGSHATENAVDAALRWFKRHQSPNGQWDVDGYPANCTEPGAKCEPGTAHRETNGDGDVACSGYAVLAFLGAGYDHVNENKFRSVVQNGLNYLVSVQNPDGSFGKANRNYENGVATMALAEAYAMTMDEKLRAPAQKAVDYLLSVQNGSGGAGGDSYGGLGWDYTKPTKRHDSSVTGWVVMALKSAKAGGLNVGNGMTGAKNWFEKTWNTTNEKKKPSDPYKDRSVFPYVWNEDKGAPQQGWDADKTPMGPRTAIGLCVGVFLGHGAGDIMMETMANDVLARAIDENQAGYQISKFPLNTYYLYYNTLGVFQVGGERWKKWNAVASKTLVDSQRKEAGCFDGSWDFEGSQFHGFETGRLLSTAYCALSLEVYYRYAQVAGGK